MKACLACGRAAVRGELDLGSHPIANRFLPDPSAAEHRYPLVLGRCGACGVVQIVDPIPADALRAQFSWIRYSEPEGHLDAVAAQVARLPGLPPRPTALGVSGNDASALSRLTALGFERAELLDPRTDLAIPEPAGGMALFQDRLTVDRASTLATRGVRADVVVARYILEHAHRPLELLAALRRLVAPGGHILLEVPDYAPVFERLDYGKLWEEHVLYFTRDTFRTTVECSGLTPVDASAYPQADVNSLVLVARSDDAPPSTTVGIGEGSAAAATWSRFVESFPARRDSVRSFLQRRNRDGVIALFGAGHLSAAFLNLLGGGDLIDFVVDDHPDKKGMFMPGSRVPILGSEALVERAARLCLSSLSPASEARVLAEQAAFLRAGGEILSIFPGKPNSIPLDRGNG